MVASRHRSREIRPSPTRGTHAFWGRENTRRYQNRPQAVLSPPDVRSDVRRHFSLFGQRFLEASLRYEPHPTVGCVGEERGCWHSMWRVQTPKGCSCIVAVVALRCIYTVWRNRGSSLRRGTSQILRLMIFINLIMEIIQFLGAVVPCAGLQVAFNTLPAWSSLPWKVSWMSWMNTRGLGCFNANISAN